MRAVVATDSQGNMHAFSAETIVVVQKINRVFDAVSIEVDGDTIFIGNEPFAILMPDPRHEIRINERAVEKLLESARATLYAPIPAIILSAK